METYPLSLDNKTTEVASIKVGGKTHIYIFNYDNTSLDTPKSDVYIRSVLLMTYLVKENILSTLTKIIDIAPRTHYLGYLPFMNRINSSDFWKGLPYSKLKLPKVSTLKPNPYSTSKSPTIPSTLPPVLLRSF